MPFEMIWFPERYFAQFRDLESLHQFFKVPQETYSEGRNMHCEEQTSFGLDARSKGCPFCQNLQRLGPASSPQLMEHTTICHSDGAHTTMGAEPYCTSQHSKNLYSESTFR